MNNMFAAKLSELVYTASDHPDSLSEMEEFDRLILLIRKLYQILDGQHTLYRVTVCLNYRSRRGLIALDKAAVGCDAAMLRARRWRICMQIAERLSESVGRLHGCGRKRVRRLQCRLNVGVVRLDMGGETQVGGGVFVCRIEQGAFG